MEFWSRSLTGKVTGGARAPMIRASLAPDRGQAPGHGSCEAARLPGSMDPRSDGPDHIGWLRVGGSRWLAGGCGWTGGQNEVETRC